MRALTQDQVRAVKDLQSLWPDRQIVLVGAAALQRFLEMRQRETRDIDLSISIALEEYPGPLVGRPGWSPRRGHAHRWDFDGAVEVDILPAGPGLLAAGKLTWPDGTEMNLTGFRLAFEQSVKLDVAPGISIDVAPVPVLALLKMVAYLERPLQRERDLRDIALILDEWPPEDDDERYADQVLRLGLTYEQIGPYLLGERLARMTGAVEQDLVRRFLTKANDEDDPHQMQQHMIAVGPPHWGRQPIELLMRLDALARGLGDGSSNGGGSP